MPPCVGCNALTLARHGRRGRPHHHSRVRAYACSLSGTAFSPENRRDDAGSAARHAHVTANGRAVATVDDEVVAFGLARDRVLDRLIEALIAFREAQGRAQVGCAFLAQTHVELARTSEPHAIAGFAKVM